MENLHYWAILALILLQFWGFNAPRRRVFRDDDDAFFVSGSSFQLKEDGDDAHKDKLENNQDSWQAFTTFSRTKTHDTEAPPPPPSSCARILLFASSQLDPNGIGCQLNTYWQAVLTAIASGRSLVFLHKTKKSYFGCVGTTNNTNATNIPGGLSRLVRIPTWLSGHCALPCGKPLLTWLQIANELQHNPKKQNFSKHMMTCQDNVSVLLLGGYSFRHYFTQRVVPVLQQSEQLSQVWAARWEKGPMSDQIKHLPNHEMMSQDEWINQVVGQLSSRLGIISLQPWIATDIQAAFQSWIQMEPDARELVQGTSFYIGVHVRRGDKLLVEAKPWVDQYWQNHSNNDTHPNYIPFSTYMEHIVQASNDYRQQHSGIATVYVATDDPYTVRQEIVALPLATKQRFRFWVHPMAIHNSSSVVEHIRMASDCSNRYQRTLAAVMDLMLLVRANVFVGEYNSNWGRLVRTHRTEMTESGKAYVRDVRVAWGPPEETSWPR